MQTLSLTLPLILSTLASAPIETAIESVRTDRHLAGLDQTAYPNSPYLSPEELPQTIEVETCWQGFNDYYYFALIDGKIWYKPRFKRPAGAMEWRNDLEWKPFGLKGGLPG